ncbi:NosD domain-containing protein [Pseudonocardia adelaidensis]|uniref:Right handed beta helix domain-containing protein n=1 Tax=Pseudonocardia adelaidensis TaxID=648754 RepID=A0ABP9NED9_9PSEU
MSTPQPVNPPCRRTPGRLAALAGLATVIAVVLAGCAAPGPAPLQRREVAAPAAADPVHPCIRAAPAGGGADPVAPADLDVRYDPAARRIELAAGTDVSLPALAAAVDDPAALRETGPGEWLLGADLAVLTGASLKIGAPDVRWLKLSSTPERFVSVQAQGGRLDITGSCVTSWDDEQSRVDVDHTDGRAFLLASDGAQMTITQAELRHLGHGDVESYGLSWRTAGTVGSITDSTVSHLYYGLYTHEVAGLQVLDNEFHDNVLYGIDPHTGSTGLRIEGNTVHDNGKHGIILAEDCTDSVIRDNVVYRNAHHGIVLYLHSDRNLVEGNETFANTAQGINVNESGANTLRDNRVYDNGESGIGITQTGHGNTVEGNQVRGNRQDGVRVVTEATGTTVRGNTIADNVRYGVYVDTGGPVEVTGNTVTGNRAGVVSTGDPVTADGVNTVSGNHDADLVADHG